MNAAPDLTLPTDAPDDVDPITALVTLRDTIRPVWSILRCLEIPQCRDLLITVDDSGVSGLSLEGREWLSRDLLPLFRRSGHVAGHLFHSVQDSPEELEDLLLRTRCLLVPAWALMEAEAGATKVSGSSSPGFMAALRTIEYGLDELYRDVLRLRVEVPQLSEEEMTSPILLGG